MIGIMELQPDNGPRSTMSIGPGFGRCGGFRWEFAWRFVEGIGKLAGNTPGDYRGEDQKTYRKYVEECSSGQRLTVGESPKSAGKPLVPIFPGMFDF
ncbi:hypothetical protein GW17_00053577 [Ensete ventricosum]|nr:hypothetical protein GW17_00053577 [Ensete ventricosum]